MQDNAEKWQELCARAAVEKDPQKLHELVREINRLLFEKEQRLAAHRKAKDEWQKD